jgi:hypothetical protein
MSPLCNPALQELGYVKLLGLQGVFALKLYNLWLVLLAPAAAESLRTKAASVQT